MALTTPIHSWIHLDSQPNAKGHSSTKSQVFRHVAAHRKLKRQQRTLKLRASALDVLKTLQVACKDLPCVDKHLCGSDDPFDTLPIPITPEISDLLYFNRTHLSPALSVSKIPLPPSSAYLQDELAVHGYLARIAAVKWRCCGDDNAFNLMLQMKAEAMQLLRLSLPQADPTRLPRAVMALMFTENWCRNINSALVHVRLLETINTNYGLHIEDLINVLHSDVQRAALTMEPAMFAMHEKSWDILEAESALPTDAGWDKDFLSARHPILTEMGQALAALDIIQEAEALQSHRQAATIKCLHVMGLLLDHYNLSSDITEKYTALAALYRIRREANMERISVCGITVFDAGRVIVPRLKELLLAASDDPRDLRVWTCWVGMMSGDSWFCEELDKQLRRGEIGNPSELSAIIASVEGRQLPQQFALLVKHAPKGQNMESCGRPHI
ncbi:hypothetical protein G647_03811 [Cladophialophora carrionii CBS 160.54]|uniref:Uncharacterized protein n=1 Tax=Cladophialophora carrionii CBS 160.54 TaxID=1279043 RepID=V9DES2_9EURO|nr:uncharacterized protein G647_03811 [Cladophialophora carrionii CBS 160.54]ETI24442.1 hypothetical protein G647_03811 [Cladophialophora carrionii CBS 160.54]